MKKEFLNKIEQFIKKAKKPLIVILGPTASGKTALSLKIAEEINGEIISADSRQIYKGLEIGSAQLPLKDRKEIPHHLIAITTPDKPLSVAEFKDLANQKIDEIFERNHIPLLVGGTGLYISAIVENYDVSRGEIDPKLRKKLEKMSAEKLQKMLEELDPEAAKTIHPNNLRYVIRAIEVNLLTGKNKRTKRQKSLYDVLMIGINYPREELYERINKRVDEQVKDGLIQEVKSLLEKGYDEKLPAMTSLGVKEIIPYIKGQQTLEQALETLKMNTRRYAKRQMTWFRRYDNVVWLSPDEL